MHVIVYFTSDNKLFRDVVEVFAYVKFRIFLIPGIVILCVLLFYNVLNPALKYFDYNSISFIDFDEWLQHNLAFSFGILGFSGCLIYMLYIEKIAWRKLSELNCKIYIVNDLSNVLYRLIHCELNKPFELKILKTSEPAVAIVRVIE